MFKKQAVTDTESALLAEQLRVLARVDINKTHQWLMDSEPHEIQNVRRIIAEYPSMPENKQQMITYMLDPLVRKDSKAFGLHDTLAMHEAFYGPSVISGHQYRFTQFKELVLGLRDKIKTPLDVTDPTMVQKYRALLYFAFELNSKNLMVTKSVYHRGVRVVAAPYYDPRLKDLVLQNTERVDELVAHAHSRESLDVDLLTMLLNDSGSRALLEGAL